MRCHPLCHPTSKTVETPLNKNVVGSGCVKDRDDVDDSRIKQVWKEYFEKLLNEEFEWNKVLLEDASRTERIT